MSDSPRDPEIARLTDELSTTLSELRSELDEGSEPPRGPFGVPRPPSPRELLRFTDEFTIPTAIAVLEANIRMLEAFQAAIRLARAGDEATERGREVREHTEKLGRGTLDRLDDVLVDLQDALDGRPQNPAARTLLDDARALRGEIDEHLRDADQHSNERLHSHDAEGTERDRRPREDGGPSHSRDATDEGSVAIDVDSELDSIRDEIGDDANDDTE